MKKLLLLLPLLFLFACAKESSNSATILDVSVSGSENAYTFGVKITSPDVDCNQYTSWWEVLREDGSLVYRRILLHSHAKEQPFRRSGGVIAIFKDEAVYIRAHMNTSLYAGNVFKGSVASGFFEVKNPPRFDNTIENLLPQPKECWY